MPSQSRQDYKKVPDLLINVRVKIDQVFQPREDTPESNDGETTFPYTNAEMVRSLSYK